MMMEILDTLLGLDTDKPEILQMAARAVVVFFTALLFIRIAGVRTLGKQTAFDTLTLLMLGAIMGRSIVAAQSFFGSLLAALVIMLLHRLTAWLSYRNKNFGIWFKGENILLIKNGRKQNKNLAKSHITEDDIMEALRHDVNTSSFEKIKEVHLERSGEISIVKE